MKPLLVETGGLPPGWTSARLGELLPLNYGKALNARLRSGGLVPVYGSSGVVGFHDEALVAGPSLIVGRKGAAGAVHFVKEPCYPIDTVYFTTSPHLDLAFFANLLVYSNLERLDQSTAVPSLSRDSYDAVVVSFPPLAEQRRIVERIEELFSELDAGLESLRRARRLLGRYRQSVLQAAVTGELTRDWRAHHPTTETGHDLLARILTERRRRWGEAELAKLRKKGREPKDEAWKQAYREPVGPDTAGLPELPEGWVWASVEQLCHAERSIAYGVLVPGPDVPEGVSMVRVGDINGGKVANDGLKHIAPQIDAAFSRTRLHGGEVLLSVVGTIGRSAVASPSLRGANVARAVAVLPVFAERAAWVSLWLDRLAGRQALERRSHEVARKTLNLEDVRPFAVPIAPAGEQAAAIGELGVMMSVVEVMEREVEAEERRAAALRQSILAAAFRGELVPQDPGDEPASALLDRIRAERAAAPVVRRRREGAQV